MPLWKGDVSWLQGTFLSLTRALTLELEGSYQYIPRYMPAHYAVLHIGGEICNYLLFLGWRVCCGLVVPGTLALIFLHYFATICFSQSVTT